MSTPYHMKEPETMTQHHAYSKGSYKGNPALAARRAAIRAYWYANPAATAKEVGAAFGLAPSSASTMRPYEVRQMNASTHPLGKTGRKLEQEATLRRMYAEDATLAEMAEVANLSQRTVKEYLRDMGLRP